jgi:hypothetical protein
LRLAGTVSFLSGGVVGETEPAVDAETEPASDVTAVEQTTTVGGAAKHAAAVALDGTTALVGVPPAPETATTVGRAVVLTRSGGGWTQQTVLSPDGDGGARRRYGRRGR